METRKELNEQTTEHRSRRTLERPETYDPASYNYPKRSVKPIEPEKKADNVPNRNIWTIVGIGCGFGIVGGIFLTIQDSNSGHNILQSIGSGGAAFAHCLIWGAILGALLGLCLFPLYKRLRYTAPVFALLLFLPTILYLLTTPLTVVNTIVIAVLKILVAIVVVGVIIFLVKTFFCD